MAARSIKDAIAGGRLKRFMDRRLIRALSHPLREHVLAVLNERIASPSEIGREIDLEVPAFYHHVEVLEELGCIERVETRRRRGAEEHFFRARATVLFDDRAWRDVPAFVRSDVTTSQIQSIFERRSRPARWSLRQGRRNAHHLAAGDIRPSWLARNQVVDERNAGADNADTGTIQGANRGYW